MITPEMVDRFMRVDAGTVTTEHLADISALTLDLSLPQERRPEHVQRALNNPLCFRCGEMGIKLEFDDNAPPIQTVLTSFLLHKKCNA